MLRRCSPVIIGANVYGSGLIIYIWPDAQFPETVAIAPAPQASIRLYCQRKTPGSRDLNPVRVRPDLLWRIMLVRGAIAQLSLRILAPAPECAIGLQGQRVRLRGRNAEPVVGAAKARRRNAILSCAIAQLAAIISTPGPQAAILPDCERVARSGGDSFA